MSRPLRIEYPNAWYHVMNRGAAKQLIFRSNNHYQTFLDLLNEIHNKFQVEIHAYCLMPNHYHILIKTPLPNLSQAMRHLNSLYTRRYNDSQKRDGPLFRGRFKSVIVDNENYVLQLSRYIHLNPVLSNIVTQAANYLWSSYRAYLNQKLAPNWLATNEILNRFDSRKVQKYRVFVDEGLNKDKEINMFYKKLHLPPILGSKVFIQIISEKYFKNKTISREIPQQKQLKQIPTIEQIISAVARYYGVDELFLKTIRRRNGNKPRQIAIYLASKLSEQKYNVIANKFTRITTGGVAKIYQRITREISVNRELAKVIKTLVTFVSSLDK